MHQGYSGIQQCAGAMLAALVFVASGARAADLSSSFRQPAPAPAATPVAASATPAKSGLTKTSPAAPAPAPATDRELFLSDLDAQLSASAAPLSVHLCFAGLKGLTELEVAQGAVIVQALALRAGNVPLHVTYGPQLSAVRCNVLIGTVEQAKDFLPAEDLKRVQRCILGLRRLPGRADSLLLVVAGKTPEAITDAVMSLTFVRSPLPEAPTALIREVTLPDQAEFVRQPPLESGAAFTLGLLMERGAPARPLPTGGVMMTLFFPGYLAPSGGAAKLTAHFQSRAQGFRGNSNLVVRLNGREVATVKRGEMKSSPLGGNEATVTFPVESFTHGANTLEIVPDTPHENFQVFADSTLQLPRVEQPAALPDLRNTTSSLFPFVGQPDGSELAIALADTNPETIQSAWILLARLAQGAQTVLYAADLSFGTPREGRHALVIGPYPQLAADVQVRMPFAVFDTVAALEAGAAKLEQKQGKNLKELIDEALHGPRHEAKTPTPSPDAPSAKSGATNAKEFGYLGCLAPPKSGTHWTLVLTAFTPELLLARTQKLVQAGWWERIEGDVVRWTEEPPIFQSNVPVLRHLAAPQRTYVEMPLGERIDVRVWMALVGVGLAAFCAATVRVLNKFERQLGLRQST